MQPGLQMQNAAKCKENEGVPMRYLFQRIVHNEYGWVAPSPGRLKFTGDGEYLEDHGFGHEDWNFRLDKSVDGYIQGYIYYRPKDPDGLFNVLFAIYDKGDGWALVGFYKNAHFNESGAKFHPQILRRRAEELKRLDEAKSLGGDYRGASVSKIASLLKKEAKDYRWHVLPKNIHRMQEPLRLPQRLTSRLGAYFDRPTELSKGEWNRLVAFSSPFTDKKPKDDYSTGGDTEFPEGRKYEVRHKIRERNVKLVARAKALFKAKHGRVFCEACDFDFSTKYGSAGDGFIEVHHKVPVCELTRGATTKVSDLALVCSNCHRILHHRRPWLSISALRKLIRHASL
jgi:hypothetical protein